MATINFKKGSNHNINRGPRKQSPTNITSDFLYRHDNRGNRDQIFADLGYENPAYSSMANTGGDEKNIYDGSEHAYKYINKYRTCDMMIGYYFGAKASYNHPDWGNWRIAQGNRIVPDQILLTPENKIIDMGFSHSLEATAYKDLAEKGMLKKITGTLEAARILVTKKSDKDQGIQGKAMSRYANVPQWNGSSSIKVPSQVKFNFNFGQAGLFSGEYEVVRPILAIASQFTLRYAGSANRFSGPAPTGPAYLASFIEQGSSFLEGFTNSEDDEKSKKEYEKEHDTKGWIQKRRDDLTGAIEVFREKTVGAREFDPNQDSDRRSDKQFGIVEKLSGVESALFGALDNSLQRANQGKLKMLFLRFGRAIIGPFYATEISWDFSYDDIDEYGFPLHGSISIGGLQSPYLPLNEHLLDIYDRPLESSR